MEPMTLGSPISSPGHQNPTSPYLPGFLMGDPAPQTTSPTKTPRQVHFAPDLSTSAPAHGTPLSAGTSLNENYSRFHKNQREKSGGPPTVGLFDTLDVSSSSSAQTYATFQQPAQVSQTPPQLGTASPAQHFDKAEESEKWVTVFGFPPSAASSILGQFSQVGHIVEHRFPGQGNWVNICYATKLDARRALSYNGKVIGGHTMIGVVPCRDYMAPGSALKDMTNMMSSNTTPVTPKSPWRQLTSPPASPYTPHRAGRPLGVTSPIENEVIGGQNTPTKNTSLVTKAVDFVFGW